MTSPATTAGRPSFRFLKRDRLLRRDEFVVAQQQGRRVHATHFTILLRDRGDQSPPRLGVTTSRKTGKSVVRSRVRRLVREVFRLHRAEFPVGVDCVVIAREEIPPLDFARVRAELLGALLRKPRNNERNHQERRSSLATPSATTSQEAQHRKRDRGAKGSGGGVRS